MIQLCVACKTYYLHPLWNRWVNIVVIAFEDAAQLIADYSKIVRLRAIIDN